MYQILATVPMPLGDRRPVEVLWNDANHVIGATCDSAVFASQRRDSLLVLGSWSCIKAINADSCLSTCNRVLLHGSVSEYNHAA
jgi:hypothetical protein